MNRTVWLTSAALAVALSGAATADGGGYHGGGKYRGGGRYHGGVWIGAPVVIGAPWPYFYGYPRYYYPPPYYPPGYYPAPYYGYGVPVVPPSPGGAGAPPATAPLGGNWYYCAEVDRYYPYAQQCPGGWQAVPAQPGTPRQ